MDNGQKFIKALLLLLILHDKILNRVHSFSCCLSITYLKHVLSFFTEEPSTHGSFEDFFNHFNIS